MRPTEKRERSQAGDSYSRRLPAFPPFLMESNDGSIGVDFGHNLQWYRAPPFHGSAA